MRKFINNKKGIVISTTLASILSMGMISNGIGNSEQIKDLRFTESITHELQDDVGQADSWAVYKSTGIRLYASPSHPAYAFAPAKLIANYVIDEEAGTITYGLATVIEREPTSIDPWGGDLDDVELTPYNYIPYRFAFVDPEEINSSQYFGMYKENYQDYRGSYKIAFEDWNHDTQKVTNKWTPGSEEWPFSVNPHDEATWEALGVDTNTSFLSDTTRALTITLNITRDSTYYSSNLTTSGNNDDPFLYDATNTWNVDTIGLQDPSIKKDSDDHSLISVGDINDFKPWGENVMTIDALDAILVDSLVLEGNEIILDYKFEAFQLISKQKLDVTNLTFTITGPKDYVEGENSVNASEDETLLFSFDLNEDTTTISENNTTTTIDTSTILNISGEQAAVDAIDETKDSTDGEIEFDATSTKPALEVVLAFGENAPETFEESGLSVSDSAIYHRVNINTDSNKLWQLSDYKVHVSSTATKYNNSIIRDDENNVIGYTEEGREVVYENLTKERDFTFTTPAFEPTQPVTQSVEYSDLNSDLENETIKVSADFKSDIQDAAEYQIDDNAPTSLTEVQLVNLNNSVDVETEGYGGEMSFGNSEGPYYEIVGSTTEINDLGNTIVSGTVETNPLRQSDEYNLAIRYVYGGNSSAHVEQEEVFSKTFNTTPVQPITVSFTEVEKVVNENDDISFKVEYNIDTANESESIAIGSVQTNLQKIEVLDSGNKVMSTISNDENDADTSGVIPWFELPSPDENGIIDGVFETRALDANKTYTFNLKYYYGYVDGVVNTDLITYEDTITLSVETGTRGYKVVTIEYFTPQYEGGEVADIDVENETIEFTSKVGLRQSPPSGEHEVASEYDYQNITKFEIYNQLENGDREIIYTVEGEEIDNSSPSSVKQYYLTYDLIPHTEYNIGVMVYSNDQEPISIEAEPFETANAGRFIPRIASTIKDDSSRLVEQEDGTWTWDVIFNVDIEEQIEEMKNESIYTASRTSSLTFDFLYSDKTQIGETYTIYDDTLTPEDSSDDIGSIQDDISFNSPLYEGVVANDDYVFRLTHTYYEEEDYLETGDRGVKTEIIDIDYHLIGLGNEELVQEDVTIETATSTLSSLAFSVNINDKNLIDPSYTTYDILDIKIVDAEGNNLEADVKQRSNVINASNLRDATYDVVINDIPLGTDISEYQLKVSTDSENNVDNDIVFEMNYSFNLLELMANSMGDDGVTPIFDGENFYNTPTEGMDEEVVDFENVQISLAASEGEPTASSFKFNLHIEDPKGILSDKSLTEDDTSTSIENSLKVFTNDQEFSIVNMNMNITNISSKRALATSNDYEVELLNLEEDTKYSDFRFELNVHDNMISEYDSTSLTTYENSKQTISVSDESDFAVRTKLVDEAFVAEDAELVYIPQSVTYDSFLIDVEFESVFDATDQIYEFVKFTYKGQEMDSRLIGASTSANTITYEIYNLTENTTYSKDGWTVTTLKEDYWNISPTRELGEFMFETRSISLSEDITTLIKPVSEKSLWWLWLLIIILLILTGVGLFLVWFFLLSNKYKVVETTEVSEGKASFRVNSDEEFSTLINGRELKGTQGGVESTLKYTISGDVITVTGISNDSNISKLVFPADEAANAKALEAFEKDLAKWETAKAKAKEAEQEFTDEKPVKPNLAKDIKLGGSVKSEIKPEVEEKPNAEKTTEENKKD